MVSLYRRRVLICSVMASLAASVAPAGCSEGDPGCAEIVAVHSFSEGRLCDLTPSGYYLREEGDHLSVGQVSAAEAVEITNVAGFGCGQLAHDPESGTLWVTGPSAAFEGPHTLYELSEDGAALGETVLEFEDTGKAMQTNTLLVHEGKLYIGGTMVDTEVVNNDRRRAFLQRRGLDGTIDWTELDYSEAQPEGIKGVGWFNSLSDLVAHDGGLSFFARRWGTDTAYVALVTVDVEGTVVWSAIATPEGFLGPYPELASDGAQLYISEERQAVLDSDRTTLIKEARELITTYSSTGEQLWDIEISWSGLRKVDTSNAARVGGKLFNSMSGANAEGERQVWLNHQGDDGELLCSRRVDDDGLYSAHALRALDSGELGMLAVGGPPDEYGNAPDNPEPRILILDPSTSSSE